MELLDNKNASLFIKKSNKSNLFNKYKMLYEAGMLLEEGFYCFCGIVSLDICKFGTFGSVGDV